MINIFQKKYMSLSILLLFILTFSVLIFYKIPLSGYYYMSALGDTREQYVHFFNHYYDLIHNGEVPFWSWEYGMGGSFWNDFGYYMLGDVFIWPLFLFPKAWFPALFLPSSILKMLLMGTGSYFFFKKTGADEKWAFLGALIYPFAGYHFDYFYTHYFFINAAVYFPFILLGYERFLKDKKPGLLILMIFLASIGNFYLMFLLTIGLFIYALFRYFHQHTINKSVKGFLWFHVKLSLVYLAGLGLSMPFFLPSVISYLQSNAQVRSGPEFETMLTMEENIQRIIHTGGMHYIVFAIIPLLLVSIKKRYPYLILLGIIWGIMQFPQLTSLIGGFSKPEELRGFFIINLLSIFIAVQVLSQLKRNKLDIFALIIGIAIVTFWLFKHPFTRYNDWLFLLPAVWGLGILVYLIIKNKMAKYILFLFSSILCLSYSTVLGYSFVSDLMIKTKNTDLTSIQHKGIWPALPLLDRKQYEDSYNYETFKKVLNDLDSGFYRTVANVPGVTAINSSLTYDYKGFYSYQSLVPWQQQKFEMDVLAQPGLRGFNLLRGFGNSTYLTTLFSNKYYINHKNNAPKFFGYKLEETHGNIAVYKNQFFLPLGFVYEHTLSTDQFLKLPVYQREQAMLNYAITDDAPFRKNLDLKTQVISALDDITINDMDSGNLRIKSEKPIDLKVPTPIKSHGQLYVYADITPLTPNGGLTINAKSNKLGEIKYEKNMRAGSFVLSQYSYKETVNEVLFRFGEASGDNKEITLSLLPGEYIIKDVKALLDPMDEYKKQVNALKQNSLNGVKYNSYSLSGTLTDSKAGTLFLSIPYNTGWHAKVDGEKTDVFKTHYTYTGISVPSGSHKVELYFIPPGFVPGGVVSLISLILLMIYYKRRKK